MKLRQVLGSLATAVALSVPAVGIAAPIYNPVGPQKDVAIADVMAGGWSLCFQGDYGGTTTVAAATAGCTGNQMMLAGGVTGSGTLQLLAQAMTSDVMTVTGLHATHNANGSDWYFNDYSWGFAPQGFGIFQDAADTNSAPWAFSVQVGDDGTERLSWHTYGTDFIFDGVAPVALDSGWRLGNDTFLSIEPSGFTRYIFTTTAVPEPATALLLSAGLALASRRLRRRKA